MTVDEFIKALADSDPGCYVSDEGDAVVIDGWFSKELIQKALDGDLPS